MRQYRIDFALIVLVGNLTRYITTRPIVEQDPTVVARWYPLRTWVHDDILRFLPGRVRIRLRHFLDSWRFYLGRTADASVIHAFETFAIYTVMRRLIGSKVVIVCNPDAPVPAPTRSLGSVLRRFALRSTDLFVPWSNYAAQVSKENNPSIPDERILVLHAGIDLTRWPLRTPKLPGERFQVLFVGSNAIPKGIITILDAFERSLQQSCDLHIVTQSAYLPADIMARMSSMPHCFVHLDLTPVTAELQRLYREADVFVLPTLQDTSSWVALEAMATGIPVVITPVGGIPDIVIDGETGFLIPPSDPDALTDVVDRLRTDPELRAQISRRARMHVEEHFDAHKNTATLLRTVKDLIDSRDRRASSRVSAVDEPGLSASHG